MRAASILGALALLPVVCAANPKNVEVENFRPAMDARSFVTVERSKILGTLEPMVGLYLNYAFNPLHQKIDGKETTLIDSYGAANLMLAMGLAHWVQFGIDMPIVIVRGDSDGVGDGMELAGEGLGDMRLMAKLRILDRDLYHVGVSVMPVLQLPTGSDGAFATSDQVIFHPKLIVDWQYKRVGLALNAGYRMQDELSLDRDVTHTILGERESDTRVETLKREPIVVGNQVTYGLGVSVMLIKDRFELVGEVFGAQPVGGGEHDDPLETLLSTRTYLSRNANFTVGVSRGWMTALGDPDLRIFAGILYEPTVGDADGDGIPDDVDGCPEDPEDKDGFEDSDGCPDPDNDQDGIPDMYDMCPDHAEDFNQFEDEDGCPDGLRDTDGDGIPDYLDRCPTEPEDLDGYADKDGCADPDNDGDGILDVNDKCPNDPETFNDFEDTDGCPDEYTRKPQRKVTVTAEKLEIIDKVYFETNKAVIKKTSYDLLDQVAQTLKENPQILMLEVQGHTDSRGKKAHNLKLSKQRAAAVRQYLIDRGVAADRLVSEGYGDQMPIDTRENREAWERNRRVEFVILDSSDR